MSAWREGFIDFRLGKKPDDNPYAYHGTQWHDWDAGWRTSAEKPVRFHVTYPDAYHYTLHRNGVVVGQYRYYYEVLDIVEKAE